jgi:hypothetical protein
LSVSLTQCVDQLKDWCSPSKLADDVTLLALEIPS